MQSYNFSILEKRGKNACLTNDIVFDVVETLDVDRQD